MSKVDWNNIDSLRAYRKELEDFHDNLSKLKKQSEALSLTSNWGLSRYATDANFDGIDKRYRNVYDEVTRYIGRLA